MARPQRNNVDYFPHECTHGRKMFIIESKYGNDGYAVWFKLLEQIGLAENHYLDLRNPTQLMYLSSLMKVSEETFISILKDLSKIGAINTELYDTHSIIWSDKFIDSIQDAYNRRNNKCMNLQGLCKHLLIKCKHLTTSNEVNSNINPHSIEYNIKKEKNIDMDTPNLSAFKELMNNETKDVILVFDGVVKIKDSEFDKLCKDYQFKEIMDKIYSLSTGIHNKDKKYTSKVDHYRTILTWLKRDKKPELQYPKPRIAL